MVRLAKEFLSFSLVTAGLGVALAQVPPAPPATPAATPDAGVPDLPEPGMPARKAAALSDADLAKEVAGHFKQIDDVRARMGQLEDIARKDKDVIKLNCVADKQLQLKELTNIAEQAKVNLADATARQDSDARTHEAGRIAEAAQQSIELGGEAEGCIGEDLTFIGPTRVVSTEPNLPEDPTVTQQPEFPVVEPLPVASPQR